MGSLKSVEKGARRMKGMNAGIADSPCGFSGAFLSCLQFLGGITSVCHAWATLSCELGDAMKLQIC